MTPFDETMLPQELQMLKIFLPFLPVSAQKMLAIYIRWIELQNTISFYDRHPPVQLSPEKKNLIDCLKHVLSPEEQAQLEQISDLFENMDLYREMFEAFSASSSPDQKEGEL